MSARDLIDCYSRHRARMSVCEEKPGQDRQQAVDRLTKAVVAEQPFCPGTIRFSLTRDYENTLVAVRLHRTNVWKSRQNDRERANRIAELSFIARHQVFIHDATDELAAYYSHHFDVPSTLAGEEAGNAIDALITGVITFASGGEKAQLFHVPALRLRFVCTSA